MRICCIWREGPISDPTSRVPAECGGPDARPGRPPLPHPLLIKQRIVHTETRTQSYKAKGKDVSLQRPAYKPLTNILIKPAGPDCNLACKYCFYLRKEELFTETRIHRMNDEVLEEMVRQMMTLGGQSVSFGWQGGEPTLMGLDFFIRAVEFQQRYGSAGQNVGNAIQTNGILIDNDWSRFLSRYHVLVGLSLDGPQHVHDHYRRTRNGKPSWERVTDSARRMMHSGVDVNALVVVSDYSARYAREIYNYLVEFGFTFLQFIPCVEPDPDHPDRCAPFSVSGEAYGAFLCEIFDAWKVLPK